MTKAAVKKNNRKAKITPGKLLILVAVVGFVLYFLYTVIWQQYMLSTKSAEMEDIRSQIVIEQQENERLQGELDEMNSSDSEYRERMAREKGGYVYPNERVFIDANNAD